MMNKSILLILLILIGLNLNAQNELQSIALNDEYSWRSHSESQLNEYYFGVKSIERSGFKYHFIHNRDGQILEVFSEDGQLFFGNLVNSTIQYKSIRTEYGTDTKADKYFYEKIDLEKEKATIIGQLILTQKLSSIPTDTLINEWNLEWLDCSDLSFNLKTNTDLKYSSYSCHWLQNDSIEYVSIIKDLYKSFSQVLDLEHKYSKFQSKLEKGKTYSSNGFNMVYMMTNKEALAFQKSKPQREYLESLRDTVDNYLMTELAKQKVQLDGINCFEDYRLIFSKNGKLEKIKVSHYNNPKLFEGLGSYFEDKRGIRKCKKRLKQIFQKINLSSFALKYKVDRLLNIGFDNKIILIDTMIY